MHKIDWDGVYNLIQSLLKELPEGKAPDLISYSNPDEAYKAVQQYEMQRQECEGLVYEIIDAICTEQRTRHVKPVAWHYIRERLQYAMNLSMLLATLPPPFELAAIGDHPHNPSQILRWLTIDNWEKQDNTILKPLRNLLCEQGMSIRGY